MNFKKKMLRNSEIQSNPKKRLRWNTKTVSCLVVVLLFSSCLKEETPVPAPVPGNVETTQIAIGWPYTNQVYYDCGTNTVVKTNTKYEWDLSFECDSNGFHVLLNTAKGIFVANQGAVPFSAVTTAAGANWLWDAPSGNLDSTAFGNWENTNAVFIVDRQFDENGGHLGYKKIQLLHVDYQSYTFKYANLNGTDEVTYTINKDATRNFIHFNFDNGGQTLALEPHKNDWDLLFTNHYHKFSNLPLPFVLTQVLSNIHNGVTVAEDNANNFQNIALLDTIDYVFTNAWDEIGYDWKIRNSQDNSFTIDGNKSYLIKTTEKLFYKIRLIDFYNETGNKGYPKFEIQKL